LWPHTNALEGNMKRVLTAALAAGLVIGATPAATAQERIPVIPEAPIVTQTYGSCVDGVWVVEPAMITLPDIYGGGWVDVREYEFTNVQPGEYPFGFQAWPDAPENIDDYYIPESPGGADDYRLEGGENGIAYYTVVINSVETQTCPKVKKPRGGNR
jgi:hypothetical protein